MAGRGPAPSGNRARERDQRRDEERTTTVVTDGALRGPDLPPMTFYSKALDESVPWPDATLAWWETWRRSAQAQTFTDTDWSFLLDTAVMHAEFWLGDRQVAAELRLRVAKFGATPEDRARLRMAVGEPVPKPDAPKKNPKSAASRRDRLLSVVNGERSA